MGTCGRAWLEFSERSRKFINKGLRLLTANEQLSRVIQVRRPVPFLQGWLKTGSRTSTTGDLRKSALEKWLELTLPLNHDRAKINKERDKKVNSDVRKRH